MTEPNETQAPDVTDNPADPVIQTADPVQDTPKEPVTEVKPDWPDDWRDKMAGDDAKLRKRLDRFQSPQDMKNSWLALEQKLSSGDVRNKLPDNATDEQIAAYRKENGIPETPQGYLENLPEGLVIGDDDKPIIDSYIEQVHGKNADPAVVATTLDWYYKLQETALEEQAKTDATVRQQNEDALRAEWGSDFRGNMTSIENFLASAETSDGESLSDLFHGLRTADGTPMGNHPAILRFLAKSAAQINPAGFVAPGAGGSQAQSISDEIAEIEAVMANDRPRYNKDTKMQKRLLDLYSAQEKMGG